MNQLLNNIRDSRVGWRTAARLAVAGMVALLWLAPPTVFAQTSSGGERYQVDRSREDYAPASAGDADFDYAAQTLRVALWLDREDTEIYRRGDEQRVGFQTNEDAYAVVYRIDTDGLVTVLWPRDRLDDGFVFGGHEYRLPGREAAALRIEEPEGEGYVQAIVSRYPFDLRALELDFLQDAGDMKVDFRVAGDPFLAMNEVNYAITGMEDAGENVITNHARYYVHQRVDHPRYLCSQCHTEDSARYDPYEGRCTLDIDYDYGWSNRWYSTYGYYPVYWNPVYVYVDPWTSRSWVNFWYDPWYVCAPYNGWYGSYRGCYSWNDSPYYRGGCGPGWDGGGRRYQPLNRHGDAVAVRKVREYDMVSRVVSGTGIEPVEREAMLARRTAAGVTRDARGVTPVTVARGDKPMARSAERFPAATAARQGGGLRIRPGGRAEADADLSKRPEGPTRRHTAAGSDGGARLAPVRPAEAGSVRSGDNGAARDSEREGIRALNPRQRGSRVWNSTTGRGSQPSERGERQERPARVSPNRGSVDRREVPAEATPTERPRRDEGQRRPPAAATSRDAVVPRAGATAPRSGQETSRPSREAAPTPARQEPPKRAETPRSRTAGDRDSGKSNEGAAKRAPSDPK
jgi:hypothetical protein